MYVCVMVVLMAEGVCTQEVEKGHTDGGWRRSNKEKEKKKIENVHVSPLPITKTFFWFCSIPPSTSIFPTDRTGRLQ